MAKRPGRLKRKIWKYFSAGAACLSATQPLASLMAFATFAGPPDLLTRKGAPLLTY